MILELIFNAFFSLGNLILGILPEMPELSPAITNNIEYVLSFIEKGLGIISLFVSPVVVQVVVIGVVMIAFLRFALAIISFVSRIIKFFLP